MNNNTAPNTWQIFMPYIDSSNSDRQLAEIKIGPNTSLGFVVASGRPLFSISYINDDKKELEYATSITEGEKGLSLSLIDLNTLEAKPTIMEILLGQREITKIKTAITEKIGLIAA